MPQDGLIVIGGGLAGLAAAVRASELGLCATVLEQGEDERYLCNSRLSGGIFHVAYNEMKAGPDALLASIRKETEGDVNEALAATGATTMQEIGKVMGAVMAKAKGRVDGNVVQAKVKERLAG